jgi:hypothetical protein
MKNILKYIVKKLSPTYEHHVFIIIKNKIKAGFKKNIENKYLFILCPPYCGSTLINSIISTSNKVSVNNTWSTREGQQLPTVRKLMFENENRWNENHDHNWQFIKQEWMKYWDLTKPVLLEKSPSNILRAKSIDKIFSNAYYIISYRNPYVHCEGIMRRNSASAEYAANFAIKCLEHQKKNIEALNNKIIISYEELTENPQKIYDLVSTMLPQLLDIQMDQKFKSHNETNQNLKIENFKKDKIDRLTDDQMTIINSIFEKKQELLSFFGYKLIT